MTSSSLTEPITIFEKFYTRLNARDVEGALQFVVEDAVFANPSGTFTGKEDIRAFLQRIAGAGHAFEFSNVREAAGRLTMAYRIFRDGKVVDEGTDGLTIIKDGKIVFDGLERTEKP